VKIEEGTVTDVLPLLFAAEAAGGIGPIQKQTKIKNSFKQTKKKVDPQALKEESVIFQVY